MIGQWETRDRENAHVTLPFPMARGALRPTTQRLSTPSHQQAPYAHLLTAMPFVVKLKKASALAELTPQTILAPFDTWPSWGDLTLKIAEEFSISSNNVGVVFLDKVDGKYTLKNEQDLQSFYDVFHPSSGKIKFVVQDLQTPDCESSIHCPYLLPIIHQSSISPRDNLCHLVSGFQSI